MNRVTRAAVSVAIAATALSHISSAYAASIGDLAKIVLNGSSILKKGEEKCGTSLGLTREDSLALTLARSAVEQNLPLSQLTALDKAAQSEAATAAGAESFCRDSKKKKSGLMKSISKAGKAILKKKALGGLGL